MPYAESHDSSSLRGDRASRPAARLDRRPCSEEEGARRRARPPADVTFRVFVRGQPIGNETVTVLSLPDGWKVMSTGQLVAPLSITTRLAEVTYDREWRPKSLLIDSLIKDQSITVKTAFAGTQATSEIVQGDKTFTKTDTVAAQTIVLPNLIFGAYEALAARLSTAQPGAKFRIYVAPQAEIDLTLDTRHRPIASRRRAAPSRRATTRDLPEPDRPARGRHLDRRTAADAHHHRLGVDRRRPRRHRDGGHAPDDQLSRQRRGRARSRPTASTSPARSRSRRRCRRPWAASRRGCRRSSCSPGSGPVDRDETVAGVPIFAQLSAALADAGYLRAALRQARRRPERRTRGVGDALRLRRGRARGGEVSPESQGRRQGSHRPRRVTARARRSRSQSASGRRRSPRWCSSPGRARPAPSWCSNSSKHALETAKTPRRRAGGENRAAEEDSAGGAHRHRLGRRAGEPAQAGRLALVQEPPRVRSDQADGRRSNQPILIVQGERRSTGAAAPRRPARRPPPTRARTSPQPKS